MEECVDQKKNINNLEWKSKVEMNWIIIKNKLNEIKEELDFWWIFELGYILLLTWVMFF